jgi:hypothetical protein
MFTHAPRIRPLRLAVATALIAGTLSGSAMAATGDSPADLVCRKAGEKPTELTMRKAGGTPTEFVVAPTTGGDQSIIGVL